MSTGRHPPRTRPSRRAATAWACTIALTLGACAEPDSATGPDSIAVTASRGPGPGTPTQAKTPRLDTNPRARWDRRGETIALTLYGSGSCPTVPTRLESDPAAGRIIVTASSDYEGVCTADLGPYTSIVKLQQPMDPSRPITLILRQEGQPDRRFRL